LTSKGITTRIVEGQTGIQDFCFLMQTKNELIGKYQSTFLRWAAFLGDAPINRFYALNQNIDNSSNYTSLQEPIRLLEYIARYNRSFISEQYWQPQE
jgi:hypothetical protein